MRTSKTSSVFILGLIMVFSLANTSFVQGKKNESFNVITYNIRMNTTGDGVNAWPLRKD